MNQDKKIYSVRLRRKNRNQYKLRNTHANRDKLRMSVFVSRFHISLQLIDDQASHTLFGFSTQRKDIKDLFKGEAKSYNMKGAEIAGNIAGEELSKLLNEKKESRKIYVDRGARKYTGRIKSFVDKIREKLENWSF